MPNQKRRERGRDGGVFYQFAVRFLVTLLLAPSNQNVTLPPSLLKNHFIFTPLDPVLGLTRGVIHSIKDSPPRGGIFKVDSEVSLSSVESIIQAMNFNMEVDDLEDFFYEAFDL